MDTFTPAGQVVTRAADFLMLHTALTDGVAGIPLPVPVRILDGRNYGLVLVDGDTCPQEQFPVITEALFTWLKSPQRPSKWKTVSVLYLYVGAWSPAVAQLLSAQGKSTFVAGYRVQSGYFDVARGLGVLPKVQGSEPQIIDTLRQSLSRERMAASPESHVEALAVERERMARALATLQQGSTWGTWLVASVCLVMFIWTCAWSGLESALAGNKKSIPTVIQLGGNFAPYVLAGEWWRLWASTFLHFGILHLALNMQGLLAVGPTLERLLGTRGYLALYAIGGLCGSLASTFYHASTPVVAAGASGAIFGVFGAMAYTVWRRQDEFPASLRHSLSGGMVPCIGYNLLMGLGGGVDNAAHIGGLVGGVAVASVFASPVGSRVLQWRVLLLIGLLPFANQVYTGAHAIRHMTVGTSPTVAYRDSQGRFSIKHADQLKPEVISEAGTDGACGVRLVGEGMLFVVLLAPSEPGLTLKAATSGFEEGLKDKVERRESRRVGSTEWMMLYGTSAKDQKVCNAIGLFREQAVLVRLMALGDSYDEAMQALPGILESLQVPASR